MFLTACYMFHLLPNMHMLTHKQTQPTSENTVGTQPMQASGSRPGSKPLTIKNTQAYITNQGDWLDWISLILWALRWLGGNLSVLLLCCRCCTHTHTHTHCNLPCTFTHFYLLWLGISIYCLQVKHTPTAGSVVRLVQTQPRKHTDAARSGAILRIGCFVNSWHSITL